MQYKIPLIRIHCGNLNLENYMKNNNLLLIINCFVNIYNNVREGLETFTYLPTHIRLVWRGGTTDSIVRNAQLFIIS